MTSIATSTASATTAAAAQSTGIKADFTLFLKLLTTQMQNQDPLNPMDTTEYTQQLVQYSQVEQSVEQNDTLKSILASLSGQNLTQASGMIGRSATFDSATAGLSATTPASWAYTATGKVATLSASVTGPDGRVAATRTLDPTEKASFVWDGRRDDGTSATPGAYTLSLSATDAAGNSLPVAVRSTGVVQEVRSAGGALTLTVNGIDLPATSLLGIGL